MRTVTATAAVTTMSHDEWWAEGERRFGENFEDWKFICPICGNVATMADFRPFAERGATEQSVTKECIGRYLPKSAEAFGNKPASRPCNYAGYGLFRLSPIRVVIESGKELHSFAFATSEVG